ACARCVAPGFLRGAVVRMLCCIDPHRTEICTLSLHDALPISNGAEEGVAEGTEGRALPVRRANSGSRRRGPSTQRAQGRVASGRSEEHTSELQSRENLVCRLLLEKKKLGSSELVGFGRTYARG